MEKPVGFSLTLPDINVVLKKMDGRVFPFGWASFFWNRNKDKIVPSRSFRGKETSTDAWELTQHSITKPIKIL